MKKQLIQVISVILVILTVLSVPTFAGFSDSGINGVITEITELLTGTTTGDAKQRARLQRNQLQKKPSSRQLSLLPNLLPSRLPSRLRPLTTTRTTIRLPSCISALSRSDLATHGFILRIRQNVTSRSAAMIWSPTVAFRWERFCSAALTAADDIIMLRLTVQISGDLKIRVGSKPSLQRSSLLRWAIE